MDFQPPEPADLANVRALNIAFVDALCAKTLPDRLIATIPDGLQAVCGHTQAAQRLYSCPFLLFSLAEHDMPRWNRLFERPRASRPDLVDAMAGNGEEMLEVVPVEHCQCYALLQTLWAILLLPVATAAALLSP